MNKKFRNLLKQILIIGICIPFFSCAEAQSQSNKNPLLVPVIKSGIAKLSGKIINPVQEISSLTLRFQNLITAEESIVETNVNADGGFNFRVPIECSVVLASIVVPGYGGVLVTLSTDQETNIELKIDNHKVLEIRENGDAFLTKTDKDNYGNVISRYMTYHYEQKPIHKMPPSEYAQIEMEIMKKRIDYAFEGSKLSDMGQNFVLNECRLYHLSGRLLSYKGATELSYLNFEGESKANEYVTQEPDSSYYSFLKFFKLDNNQYLYNSQCSKVIQRLLSAKGLNIPPISDISIDKWMVDVKMKLSDLVGFDTGQFYDLLAANAYSKQFNDSLTPLSEKQKENIIAYWGDNGEITKILSKKNEEIIQLAKGKSDLVVNQTPDVAKEKLMDAIISKYKGKTVVVDFWATWCLPCLSNMKELIEIKNGISEKDVAFIYITGESSPKYLWKEKIENIGGEHYYLTQDEWYYIMDKFEFKGIPAYLFYDQNGVLKYKKMGIIGDVEMKKRIENILP